MAKNYVDREMKMTVYNSRLDSVREVTIVPSRSWGGPTLLGAGIRYCSLKDVRDRVWHVMDISMDSPAMRSGLIPLKGRKWHDHMLMDRLDYWIR